MEIITIEDLSKRLHVSRATLFNWMQRGVFTQGKHFFKQGRVLRFVWGDDLVNALLGESPQQGENKAVVKLARPKNASPVNWDY